MTRPLRPRAPTAVLPATVSQLTCLTVLGLDERRFLEMVIPKCAHVSRVGRLRIVEVDDALRALRDLAPAEESALENQFSSEAPADEPEEQSLLSRLGRRRVARGAAE